MTKPLMQSGNNIYSVECADPRFRKILPYETRIPRTNSYAVAHDWCKALTHRFSAAYNFDNDQQWSYFWFEDRNEALMFKLIWGGVDGTEVDPPY